MTSIEKWDFLRPQQVSKYCLVIIPTNNNLDCEQGRRGR